MKKRLITFTLLYLLSFVGFVQSMENPSGLSQRPLAGTQPRSDSQSSRLELVAWTPQTLQGELPRSIICFRSTNEQGQQLLHPLHAPRTLWQKLCCHKDPTLYDCCHEIGNFKLQIPSEQIRVLTAKTDGVALFNAIHAGTLVIPYACKNYNDIMNVVHVVRTSHLLD